MAEFKIADVFVQFVTRNVEPTMRAVKKVQETVQDFSKEGAAITKEFQTPFDALQARFAQLNRLVKAGSIDMGTYKRATESALEVYRKKVPQAQGLFSLLKEGGQKGLQASGMSGGMIMRILGMLGSKGGLIGGAIAGVLASLALSLKVIATGIATAGKYSVGWAFISDKIAARWEQIKYNVGKPFLDAMLPVMKVFERLLSLMERWTRGGGLFARPLIMAFETLAKLADVFLSTMEKILEMMGLIGAARPAGMGGPATYGSLEAFSKTAQANVQVDPGIEVAKQQLTIQNKIFEFMFNAFNGARAAANPMGIGP